MAVEFGWINRKNNKKIFHCAKYFEFVHVHLGLVGRAEEDPLTHTIADGFGYPESTRQMD